MLGGYSKETNLVGFAGVCRFAGPTPAPSSVDQKLRYNQLVTPHKRRSQNRLHSQPSKLGCNLLLEPHFPYLVLFCSLWGWVTLGFSHPIWGLWGWFVFWFGLFFCLRWDGLRVFFVPSAAWCYVGWDGMRMGKYVAR